MARRFFWFTVLILFALTAYTGGWYWAADRLVQEVQARTGDLPGGRHLECENPQAKGFPFRIGLYCDSIAYSASGMAIEGGALRSAAQIYNPFRLVAETDAPARLTFAGYVPFDLNWENARGSTRLALPEPMPEIVSTELTGFAMTADIDGKPALLTADRLEVHMRPAGRDIELALRFQGLATGEILTGGTMAPLTGVVDLVWKDGMARLGRGIAGSQFTVRSIDLAAAGGGRLTATGTAGVGEDRLIDADLTLTAENVAGLTAVIGRAFPAVAAQVTTVAAGLSAMGEKPSLPLRIADGAITLGFLPLGSLPPL
ncbi:MAG: DUF2125 domain-containing protein [Rhizobiaceae bacterium]|nr:DUF2125 domain-containing protein [Rhizobiaceae bacterium]